MISNRQGGRRRGRGGQRGQNLGGNRQDNRQRGNAAQLLEKYKNMARDAQLGGDRVQSEYFLQFADHYFRVLNENRARFEDQRKQRGDDSSDEDEGEEEAAEASQEQRGEGEGGRRKRAPARSRSTRNGAEAANEDGETDDERIAVDVLPPSIGGDDEDEAEEAPKPRKRARRPRGEDGEGEVAPAA